jgi:hypothetical protein
MDSAKPSNLPVLCNIACYPTLQSAEIESQEMTAVGQSLSVIHLFPIFLKDELYNSPPYTKYFLQCLRFSLASHTYWCMGVSTTQKYNRVESC